MADATHAFTPDYAVPPGETLLEIIETLGISQSELAERTGRPKKTINEIINGKAAITSETALQFEQVLGTPASFWTSLEQNYRTSLARIAERARLEAQVGWLKLIPVRDLIKQGWTQEVDDDVSRVRGLLTYFGVASVDAWNTVWADWRAAAAFRHSQAFDSDFGTVAAWLRKGELEARAITSEPFDAAKLKAELQGIRELTTADPGIFCPTIIKRCASAGVAVCFVRELPKLRVHGVARWLTSEKALIQLTLRGGTDDHLWFTFFHEIGHILLHGKRDVFVEEKASAKLKEETLSDGAIRQREEEEANRFARDTLIPPDDYRTFRRSGLFDAISIRAFAKTLGIAPGIVVGRLQFDDVIPYPTRLNKLKRHFAWVESGQN